MSTLSPALPELLNLAPGQGAVAQPRAATDASAPPGLQGQRSVAGRLLPVARRGLALTWQYLQRSSHLSVLAKRQRRLRVSETLSLGDKRFVSILEVDGQAFLLGGSGSSLALLATLAPQSAPAEPVTALSALPTAEPATTGPSRSDTFARALQRSMERSEGR